MDTITAVNGQAFLKTITEETVPVVVFVTSPECVLCKAKEPLFQEIGRTFYQKIRPYILNINEGDFWSRYSIKAVPSLLYFKEGSLVLRQDVFPDKKDVELAIRKILEHHYDYRIKFIKDLKYAISAEYAMHRFYAYITEQTRNGKMKRVFQQFAEESDIHSKELRSILNMFSGGGSVDDAFSGCTAQPESFSLLGAIKSARKLEERAYDFYRNMEKSIPSEDAAVKAIVRTIVKEENRHMARLKKEEEYLNFKQFDESLNIAVDQKKIDTMFL